MVENADTPGKRLRQFSEIFFTSITAFAHELGYQKPGSLYDYFNDKKKPGGQLLDRFRRIGGDPNWLRYGTGTMFADSDAGRALRLRFKNSLPYPPMEVPGAPSGEQQAGHPYDDATGATLEHGESLYVLLSRIAFRLRTSPTIAPPILRLYRELLSSIEHELAVRETESTRYEPSR